MHNKVTAETVKDAKSTLKRSWSYLKKYKNKLFIVIFFIILSIACTTINSLVLAPIIDNYIIPMIKVPSNNIYVKGLLEQLGILVGTAILSSIFTYYQYKTMAKVASYTVKDMRKDLFDKLQELPVKFYDTNHYGELMSRITNDLDNVTMALNTSVDQIMSATINILVALAIMISINLKLTLVSIITMPIVIILSGIIMKLTKKQFVKQQQCIGELNGFIEEHISGQKVIKAFNREEKIKEEFKKHNDKLKKEGFKAQAYGSIIMPIMGSITNISNAIIYTLAGIFAIKGEITVGLIISFTKFASQFSNPITEASQQIPTIEQALAGAERMFEIIDQEIEFKDSRTNKNLENVKGLVEFKNVSFGYEKDNLILKNVSFIAKPGETIAIVGPTGAGKTTMINLLTRFYDTTEGSILIDKTDIKDVNFYSLRESLGIVLQDTILFSDTVMQNIRYGNLAATNKEVIEAAKIAKADNFITKLPNKYNTVLNEDSSNISVGQRQLLNISRVILNNPKILILDEATSNVDTRTEVQIQEAMNHLMEGRTSFVIAHRLSTIRNADKILVINDGMIVEQGNHKELIKKHGTYYDMYTGMFDKKA